MAEETEKNNQKFTFIHSLKLKLVRRAFGGVGVSGGLFEAQ